MKSTREKILDKSRELFNKYGITKISQRKISDALNISPGNLTYHFKKREEIVEALYYQLVDKLNNTIEEVGENEISLESMFYIMDQMLESFFDYRFFFLDFVHVMRENESIRKYHEELTTRRKGQLFALLKKLIDNQLIREEEFEGEYQNLFTRFQILVDFWISSAEISNNGVKKSHLDEYKIIIRQTLYPYLTSKGKKAYNDIC